MAVRKAHHPAEVAHDNGSGSADDEDVLRVKIENLQENFDKFESLMAQMTACLDQMHAVIASNT